MPWCSAQFSQMTVPPMPSPIHIVVRPYRTSGRAPRAARARFGHEPYPGRGQRVARSAIAPPRGFTRGSSSARPKWSSEGQHLHRERLVHLDQRPMSSIVRPALRQRLLGGRVPARRPSTLGLDAGEGEGDDAACGLRQPQLVGGCPRTRARRHPVAPSLRPDGVAGRHAAVRRGTGVLQSLQRSSTVVVPGRGGIVDCAGIGPSPAAERVAIGHEVWAG